MIQVGYIKNGEKIIHETVTVGGAPAANSSIAAVRLDKEGEVGITKFFMSDGDYEYAWLDPL